jgi:Tol biopolymer transport system component
MRRAGVGLVLVVSTVFAGADAPTATAEPTDWIAFVRDPTGGTAFESGDEEIAAIRADGTGSVQLTQNTCIDILPAASPDGRWLAWAQKCKKVVDIIAAPIVYDELGQLGIGPQTNLTAVLGSGADRWPSFSPDGSQISFMRRTAVNFDIWRGSFVVTDGVPSLSDAVRAVRLGESRVEDCCAAWSPDGASIVWASNLNKTQRSFDLYRVSADATDVWDGKANTDGSSDGTLDVRIVEQLTSRRNYEGTPSYDADGTILFRCNCVSNPDVYRLDPLTGARSRLTTHAGMDRTPERFPGGIVYSRYDDVGADEIYVAGPAGESPIAVTLSPSSDRDPAWIPPPQT